VHSTHDWTATQPGEDFVEAWADVKTPGNGRTYSVGTMTIRETTNLVFSNMTQPAISNAWPLTWPGIPQQSVGSEVPVIVIQCTDRIGGIVWQKYFYGQTPLQDSVSRGTNARAISVWPDATLSGTRIAICGETFDQTLPGSSSSPAAIGAAQPNGFIAVLDGSGDLLWSHHLFGSSTQQRSAVTDLSIRVQVSGESVSDVVTYCGISSHGNPGPGLPLSPKLPFDMQSTFLCNGDTNHGPGQWDGIVGRVTRTGTSAPQVTFHSIVGGPDQDGLWGLAEVDIVHFVAVGSHRSLGLVAAGLQFPMPQFVNNGWGGPCHVGVVLHFDASNTGIQQSLILDAGGVIGDTLGVASAVTIARDVIVAWHTESLATQPPTFPGADHAVFVVGETSDPDPFGQDANGPNWPNLLFSNTVGTTISGTTDGFLMAYSTNYEGNFVGPRLAAWTGTIWGTPGSDGLIGIQSWNEFGGHFAVVGHSTYVPPNTSATQAPDMVIETHFYNNGIPGAPSTTNAPSNGTFQILPVRKWRYFSDATDRAAAMGPRHAYAVNSSSAGLAFDVGPLWQPQGGGIAVDERGRVTAVGQTSATDYLVHGGRDRDGAPGADAVRTDLDMVPGSFARSDGTGEPSIGGLYAALSQQGGTTTPACALNPFGARISPTGSGIEGLFGTSLPRMLIDFEGNPPTVGTPPNSAILVVRATPRVSLAGLAVLQIGVPLSAPVTGLFGPSGPFGLFPADLSEAWITGQEFISLTVIGDVDTHRVYRVILPPGGVGGAFTVQMFALLAFDPVGPGGACFSYAAASPAMFLQF